MIKESATHTVVLAKYENAANEKCFAFIRSSAAGIQKLKSELHSRRIVNFSEVGNVLLSGLGEPDESVHDYIEMSYGKFLEL